MVLGLNTFALMMAEDKRVNAMVKRKAYFLDADYVVKNNKTYVRLLLKGKRLTRLYYQYDPYFLVEAPPEKKDALVLVTALKPGTGVIKPLRIETVERKTGQEKKKLFKVVCAEPSHVPLLKAAMPFKCFESSILFGKRFIFDMRLTPLSIIYYERKGRFIKKVIKTAEAKPELKMLAFDIETYNPEGAPRAKKDQVIMIGYACKNKNGVLTWKQTKEKHANVLDDERSMIKEFSALIEREDPDIILGYNSTNFDLPYLWERSDSNKADIMLGKWSPEMRKIKKGLINGIALDGRIHIDLYPLVRFFSVLGIIQATRFTLDAVAGEMLGKKKTGIKKEDIWKFWDAGKVEELVNYCMRDAELTKELAEQMLPLEMELSSITKMPLFDAALSTSGQLVENLLMYSASEKGVIIPSKPADTAITQRLANPIQGALVKLPEPGIYENIAVLDFRGLYPSIIVSYNIDPGTLVADGKSVHISPTGAKFLKKPQGLVPSVLDWLVDFRTKIKKKVKSINRDSSEYVALNARSQALKILTNSFYGYLGYARSRWYSRECAESVTAWGRKHIMETMEKAEKTGFRVLYTDTDSVFLLYKDEKDVMDFMESVNRSLPEKMELELEAFYSRGVFVGKKGREARGAKKKYALLGKDGRIKIRGFELVRRDWSAIAKNTQRKVLEVILKEGSKEKAAAIVKETVKRLQSSSVPLEELAIHTQLKKDPKNYEIISPELSAAKKALARGMQMEKGSMIAYVITKNGKTISEKAELLDFAGDYDADYYVNNQVLPAVMKILKELGYDEYGLKVGGKQKSLDSFF
jgi:DNA polymerase I